MRLCVLRRGIFLAAMWCGTYPALAQNTAQRSNVPASVGIVPDFELSAHPFPHIFAPYRARSIPGAQLSNGADAPLSLHEGKLQLSVEDLVTAVIENNLTVASARYYPAEARTDLLRARSGNSPRGIDASVIPSSVFAGAQGGSILGTAGGGGAGGPAAGGITSNATQVIVRPAGLFDPTFSANFSYDHTSSPLNTLVVAGVPSVTNSSFAVSLSYVQELPTGTSIAASYGLQRQASTQLRLLFNPYFSPGFSASVSQQLLKGFGYDVNRVLIKVAENEQSIERESFREQLVAALSSAEDAYWDLIAAQQQVRVAAQALTVARLLEQNNQAEVNAGVMSNLDLVTAQSQVAASQRDLTVAQANVQYAELQLKSMLSENLDEPLASAPVEATESFPDPENAPLPSLSEALADANRNRPELAVAQGNIKSQLDVAPFLRNALLPNLNAFAQVSTVGLYNVFGTAFTEALQFKYPQWAVGINLNFSAHNRQAQADNIRSRLELKESQDTMVHQQSQVAVDVKNALIALRQGKAQVAAAKEAARLNQIRLDAENEKLSVGLSTSYAVILVQRDLFASELTEVQARDAYAKALVAFDQATGVTLEHHNVSLDDALRGRITR
jgi:outer membrane protein TolC